MMLMLLVLVLKLVIKCDNNERIILENNHKVITDRHAPAYFIL